MRQMQRMGQRNADDAEIDVCRQIHVHLYMQLPIYVEYNLYTSAPVLACNQLQRLRCRCFVIAASAFFLMSTLSLQAHLSMRPTSHFILRLADHRNQSWQMNEVMID